MSKMLRRFIAPNAIGPTELGTDALGNGLQGGAGTVVSVKAKALSGVTVDADGVAAVVDGSTIALDGSGNIYIPEGGVGASQVDVSADFAWTGIQNLTGATVTVPNIMSGSVGNSPATKDYVDQISSRLSWKQAVRAATLGDITLSGLQTVDGVSLVAEDRVLVKNQADPKQNGIYLAAAGAWVRAVDADSTLELNGAVVGVVDGSSVNKGWQFVCISVDPVIGTDDITFTVYGAGKSYTNGVGLALNGTEFSVRLGAGIIELPEGEVGVDLATDGGLGFTEVGADGKIKILRDVTTGSTVAPINTSTNGAGMALDDATLTHTAGVLSVKDGGIGSAKLDLGTGAGQINTDTIPASGDFTPTNYVASTSYDGLTNHLAGIDAKLGLVSAETFKQVSHVITAAETTAGYIDISGWASLPKNAQGVRVTPAGGPEQKSAAVFATGSVDFEVRLDLTPKRICFNAAGGGARTLTGDLSTDDVLIVSFVADSAL